MPFPPPNHLEPIGILLLLKAFAGGSVALTGVEAIANGVPAFKPPEAKNAANTMTAMSILLGVLFIGLTLFAVQYGLRPTEAGGQSIVAMAAGAAFGEGSALFVTFAASTALILFLAANTSFNAFPRLAAILAEDGYMPRQFSLPRRSAGLLVGHRPAGGHRVRAAVGVRRRHPCADPALLGRRVRVLHAEPDRDGPALAERARVRLALARDGQRVRRPC